MMKNRREKNEYMRLKPLVPYIYTEMYGWEQFVFTRACYGIEEGDTSC